MPEAGDQTVELVGLALRGDDEAFAKLIHIHQGVVFALAYQRCMNRSDSEDIAQESFVRAHRNLRKLRKPARFVSWLYGIAVNVSREHMRRQRTSIPLDRIDAPAAESAGSHDDREMDKLLMLVSKLPDKFRIPLTMHYMHLSKYCEIGRLLGITEGAARSRVHRAKAMVRKMMNR